MLAIFTAGDIGNEGNEIMEDSDRLWCDHFKLAQQATSCATAILTRIEAGKRDMDEFFVETHRETRVGKLREPDLLLYSSLFREDSERYVVTDVQGRLVPSTGTGDVSDGLCVRFETWCRLYHINDKWYLHFVDAITRSPGLSTRMLFTFANGEDPYSMKLSDAETLCLFSRTPQGGMF